MTVDAHVERDDREWERGGGARFSIPLFDRRQGALAAHEAEFDALAARHQATAVAIRSSARESRDRLLSAYRRARHYREIVVPARRRVVEHAVRQLNAMAINVFELLRFQREQLESELAASDALRDYWIARAAFDALAAGTSPGSRRAVRRPARLWRVTDMNRRSFLALTGAAAGAAILRRASAQETHPGHGAHEGRGAQGEPTAVPEVPAATPAAAPAPSPALGGNVPVTTPNGATLPWRTVRGVKVGHLVAGEFEHAFAPGLRAHVYGYAGRTPGPTIEAVEGDQVRIYVTNRLPAPTTIHWHGFVLPNGMDGVAGLNQKPIPPGETYVYEFTIRHPGTFLYHSHFDEMTQLAFGLVGMFVVHPRRSRGPRVVRDFAMLTHEWRIDAGTRRPDPNEMSDFNVLTFNGKAFPGTQPTLVGRGERVRIRLGNLSTMSQHPIHLHGLQFEITGTDGGDVPPSARSTQATVILPVGGVRAIEFVPEEPGDWAMHCHMPHHMMNQMGHAKPLFVGADARTLDRRMARVVPGYMTMGTTGMGGMGEMRMPVPPNSIPMGGGIGPFAYMDLGGMFTILKVRERPRETDRAGWYAHPEGTVASRASPAAMEADGIAADAALD